MNADIANNCICMCIFTLTSNEIFFPSISRPKPFLVLILVKITVELAASLEIRLIQY
jgi:hypothetical protein